MPTSYDQIPFFFLLLSSILIVLSPSSSANFIFSFNATNLPWRPSENLTLLSPSAAFAAGFVPISSSPASYTFCIWYHSNTSDDKTPVWQTDQNSPISLSGSLSVTSAGQLFLRRNSAGGNLWPSPSLAAGTANTTALRLSDAGDLQFGSWRSFDFPTNTFLPNQTLNGKLLISSNGRFQFSSSGSLVYNTTDTYWTSKASFQQLNPDGRIPLLDGTTLFSADFKDSRFRRLTLDDDGNLRLYSFFPAAATKWVVVWRAVQELCQVHGLCGPNAICMQVYGSDIHFNCVCPPGYKRSSESDACEIKNPIRHPAKTKFLQLDYVNYTGETVHAMVAKNFTDCESECLADPSCRGFGFKYSGIGYCALQMGDRLLNGYWSPSTEAAMFLRVDRSEPDTTNFTGMTTMLKETCAVQFSLPYPPNESSSTARNIAIVSTLFTLEFLIGVLSFWAFIKKYVKYRDMARTLGLELLPLGGPKRFSYADIKAATNDFSEDNMIGRGGFSDVYKGVMRDGRVVAIKCLKNVTGRDTEFWAEVNIIARMHHLNLVRLWGFCNEKDKRILIYEHVSNGSLDKFLFSSKQQLEVSSSGPDHLLEWKNRYRIAVGVARAVAYLHEECLEWVLHCDIKPENILLGDDFCPKVADFGLSKLKKKEQVVSVSGIRGTRGYMAPEWFKREAITSKVDVFSFGVVLLEMVTGNRSCTVRDGDMDSAEWYLPRWAFSKVFKEMKMEEVLDARLMGSYDEEVHMKMVERMVKTAMWCIQEKPEARPSMGKVAKMLEGSVEILEPPKPTIFYVAND